MKISVYNAPPWWLRIETIVGYVILLIGFVSFFVKYRKIQRTNGSERKSAELEKQELQNSLLPKVLPQIDGFDISTYLKPATEMVVTTTIFSTKKVNTSMPYVEMLQVMELFQE